MELKLNIEDTLFSAIESALSPEKLQPIITKNVEEAISAVVRDQFNYDSPFRKNMEAKIASVMPTDFEDMGRFGDLVLKAVTACVNESQSEFVRNAIVTRLEGLLKPMPQEMKLSKFVDMLVPALKNSLHGIDIPEQPTIIVERSDGCLSGYWHLYIDAKQYVSKYSCSIQSAFDTNGKCYSLRVDGQDIQKTLFIGPTFDADSLMLQLYTGGIKIELDQDDFSDVSYSKECED